MKLVTIPFLLAAALSAMACNKSAKKTTTLDHRGDPAARVPEQAPPREVARADLRDALLHLQRVHFGYDTATLLPAARDALERAAGLLVAHPDVHLFVDGHTDDRGTTEYNIALGDRRAAAVVDYLVRLGIARERLHPISYGEQRPARDGEAPEDRAANRRVEFRLMRGEIQLVLDDGTPYADDGTPLEPSALSVGPGR